MVVIVDLDIGNVGSIANMLRRKCGVDGMISSRAEDIAGAAKLILPGVGSFDQGMRGLRRHGLEEVLQFKVQERKTPILGICLGLQLFGERSEEGVERGLGWIRGETVKFRFEKTHVDLRVPHMGWNTVKVCKSSALFQNSKGEQRFYFVHSYHVVCDEESAVLTTTRYGCEFVSAIQQENIIGVQFHPEKSHKFGMRFLRNFVMSF